MRYVDRHDEPSEDLGSDRVFRRRRTPDVFDRKGSNFDAVVLPRPMPVIQGGLPHDGGIVDEVVCDRLFGLGVEAFPMGHRMRSHSEAHGYKKAVIAGCQRNCCAPRSPSIRGGIERGYRAAAVVDRDDVLVEELGSDDAVDLGAGLRSLEIHSHRMVDRKRERFDVYAM